MTEGAQGMPQGTPQGMPGSPKKKGMSKGCLISLIVAGVILVIIIALMVTCYLKQEELAKSLTSYSVNQMKSLLAETPPQGIDTAQFNAVADNFIQKLETDSLDMTKFQGFIQVMQDIPGDQKIDSAEAFNLMEAMYGFYPDLRPEPEMMMDADTVIDTTGL